MEEFFFVVGIENKILYNLYLNCIFFDEIDIYF